MLASIIGVCGSSMLVTHVHVHVHKLVKLCRKLLLFNIHNV